MKQIRTTIESPYEPNDNGALWLDTSNPDAPILKAFTNGKWQATIGGEKVTEIDSDSTDEEIPTAKAVNDRITVLADKVGVDLSKYEEYFTIEATVDDTTIYFRQSSFAENAGLEPLKVDVSTDGGQTWREVTASSQDNGTAIASLNAEDKVLIRGNNPAYGYYDGDEAAAAENCNFWADSPCYVYGNIMSLVNKEGFETLHSVNECAFAYFFSDYNGELDWSWVLSKEGTPLLLPATTLAYYCYSAMFFACFSLTTAPDLPATTLAESCYGDMFSECTSLTQAPALPSTTLARSCYSEMFFHCTSLTAAPVLPATTLAEYCYYNMFFNCTSLTAAPVLSATTLAYYCYDHMFFGCSSLTAAPDLPATILATSCYNSMFMKCTSLTVAPVLPAITLVAFCYDSMFDGCSNLSYIKALFTTAPSTDCTMNWVKNVNATGTFVKSANATWNVTGDNGVPNGWTIKKQNPAQRNDQADWGETNVNSASYIWNKPDVSVLVINNPEHISFSQYTKEQAAEALGLSAKDFQLLNSGKVASVQAGDGISFLIIASNGGDDIAFVYADSYGALGVAYTLRYTYNVGWSFSEI